MPSNDWKDIGKSKTLCGTKSVTYLALRPLILTNVRAAPSIHKNK